MTDPLIPECRLIELRVRGDDRGSLVALEGGIDLPFEIARAYYIFGTRPGVSRGFHGHRQLRQVAICVAGRCTMLVDNGRDRSSVLLDRPSLGLEIGPMVWREMHDFSPDSVLLVLASEHYREADYIRDYATFRQVAGGN